MDARLKKKALQNLAKTAGDVAEVAIQKELTRIANILNRDTDYFLLEEQLELLGTIAYRVHEEAVGTIRRFLARLEKLQITYSDVNGYSTEHLQEYQNSSTLKKKAIEVLESICYHQPAEILDVFFEYSCHEEGSVSNQAIHGITEFSGYNLDIFYGDGKDWQGLGCWPQQKILEKIASFDEAHLVNYFPAVIVACEQILSPTISGTSSSYKTVTWRTGSVPAVDGVKEIRKKAVDELKNLYAVAKDVGQKKDVLNAMGSATRFPHRGEYGSDVQEMIIENTIAVAEFMESVALSDDMQIMQKIEHDAYWILYHMGGLNENIRTISLEIRNSLYSDEEFQKFRILVGFESVFHDWEKAKESGDFEWERQFRQSGARKLAECIDVDNYDEWKERIVRYASIKSKDMATFPYFGNFLQHFGKNSPELALQILQETPDQLEGFIVAILCGVVETDRKGDVYSLINDWCDKGKYLFCLARFFEFSPEMDEELINKIMNKAKHNEDLNTFVQISSTISAKYSGDTKDIFRRFFVPTLEYLTSHRSSGWIFGFWFRERRGEIIGDMCPAEHQAILNNLVWLEQIDYHAEEILSGIAECSPELVVQFFCDRLLKEKYDDKVGQYEATPFSFQKLWEPLSHHPRLAVDRVRTLYDDDTALFAFRGARLLMIMFPEFPQGFQEKLLEVVQSGKRKEFLFVLAILRNYDGNPAIQGVCKEVAKLLPDDEELVNELIIVLEGTGVVRGEYGLVEAYREKVDQIHPWLEDEDPKISKFAQKYIEILEKRIDFERKIADEDISLRKHLYGSDDE